LKVEIAEYIMDKTRHIEETSTEMTTLIATNTQKIKSIEFCHRDKFQDLHIESLKKENDLEQLQLKCTCSITNSSI